MSTGDQDYHVYLQGQLPCPNCGYSGQPAVYGWPQSDKPLKGESKWLYWPEDLDYKKLYEQQAEKKDELEAFFMNKLDIREQLGGWYDAMTAFSLEMAKQAMDRGVKVQWIDSEMTDEEQQKQIRKYCEAYYGNPLSHDEVRTLKEGWTCEQEDGLDDTWQKHYGPPLPEELEPTPDSEPDQGMETMMTALQITPEELQDAVCELEKTDPSAYKEFSDALKGTDSDDQAIMEVLKSMSPDELEALNKAFTLNDAFARIEAADIKPSGIWHLDDPYGGQGAPFMTDEEVSETLGITKTGEHFSKRLSKMFDETTRGAYLLHYVNSPENGVKLLYDDRLCPIIVTPDEVICRFGDETCERHIVIVKYEAPLEPLVAFKNLGEYHFKSREDMNKWLAEKAKK